MRRLCSPELRAQQLSPCRKPRSASCPFRSGLHRLSARVVIQIAKVINQTEKDTVRRNGLCLDGRRSVAMRFDQSGIEPSICASRTYSDNGRDARKYRSRWMDC